MPNLPEHWLRGPLPGVDPYLMPVAHALMQASDDIERAARALEAEQLWVKVGGAASAGFHLRHIAGSIDRLLTYARGEMLSEAQLAALRVEQEAGSPPDDAATLISGALDAIRGALEQVQGTPRATLLDARAVGRGKLPSTVLGLLVHVAEHTHRHTGQLITTAKILHGTKDA